MCLFFLARRYLLARWIMSGAATLAVLLAVFSLVVVRSVFEGFGDQMREMVRGTNSHLVVVTAQPMNLPYGEEIADAIEKIDHVRGAAPYIETVAMLQTRTAMGQRTDYVQLKGVDPVREARASDFAYYLLRDQDLFTAFERRGRRLGRARDRPPLSAEEIMEIFSRERRDRLWEKYRRRLAEFDPKGAERLSEKLPPPCIVGIQALVGFGSPIRFGEPIQLTTYSPQSGRVVTGEFLVVGAFHTGLFEVDLRTVIVPLQAACEFLELYDETLPDADGFPAGGYRVSGVQVALDDYERYKDQVIEAVGRALTPFYKRLLRASERSKLFEPLTMTWEQRKRNLLRAVRIEKGIVSLILGILVIFVGAIIFLILTLNVTEKRRDIGILKAVGATSRSIFAIFLIHGSTICLVGLILGFFAGLAFSENINTIHDMIRRSTGFQLFPPDVYYLDRIPVSIKLRDLGLISSLTVLFGLLGSLLPAYWAARQDPIEAIRFE